MVFKSGVGDYPLKDYPCEHWWVRYATSCTYLSKAHDDIWHAKLVELQEKYKFKGYAYSGEWKDQFSNLETNYDNAHIFVYGTINEKQIEVVNQSSELYRIISRIIESNSAWTDCPYEYEEQSKCKFYQASEFYKKYPLEELRARKGYET